MHYFELYTEQEAAMILISGALGFTSSLGHFTIEDVSGHNEFLGNATLTAVENSSRYTGSATVTYGRVEWGGLLVKNNPAVISKGYDQTTNTHTLELVVNEPIPLSTDNVNHADFMWKHIFSQLGIKDLVPSTSTVRESTADVYSAKIHFNGSVLFYGNVDITITRKEVN